VNGLWSTTLAVKEGSSLRSKTFYYDELVRSRLLYKQLEWGHLRLCGINWTKWWRMWYDPIEKSVTVEYE
jgi:hypothetical protein